jgi:hypothetical protein
MTTADQEKETRLKQAAARALAEAEARKREEAKNPPPRMPKELGGREGPEPTRFGDWERKGVISDF